MAESNPEMGELDGKKDDQSNSIVIDDNDLEDGEIDDEEDDDEPIVLPETKSNLLQTEKLKVVNETKEKSLKDPSVDNEQAQKLKNPSKLGKSVEDDFASNIENAIAAALKKDGIEPLASNVTNKRDGYKDKTDSDSKKSRRKRKKHTREEPHSGKKKKLSSAEEDVDNLDDYEMLCVRGGSPPLNSINETKLNTRPKDPYYTDDSYTSYDSYESEDYSNRRATRKVKDRKNRLDRNNMTSNRRDDDRRPDRNNRNRHNLDSEVENKHQDRGPRKLELCKFYLLECCAKKDKCSYMHSDFPCKYYYLGMECVYKADCKFSHGKPLTDQLRNTLLKHIDTAPKEILGTFRRISRDYATALLNKTHIKLCAEHGIENTLPSQVTPVNTMTTCQSHMNTNCNTSGMNVDFNNQNPYASMHQHKNQHQNQYDEGQSGNIPSLLELVIRPPTKVLDEKQRSHLIDCSASTSISKSDKPRKTRWCDNSGSVNSPQNIDMNTSYKKLNLAPPSSNAPSYLDLKNLTGLVSAEHIQKLTETGVVNLEQVNQLTVGQLNSLGLTINEINEIQLNAMNIAKLGISGNNYLNEDKTNSDFGNFSQQKQQQQLSKDQQETNLLRMNNRDVDMRSLPSFLTSSSSTSTSTSAMVISSQTTENKNSNMGIKSPEPPQNARTTTIVDYTQYLKDANLYAEQDDLNDDYALMDDEKDEESLVIADDNEDENQLESSDEKDKELEKDNEIRCEDKNDEINDNDRNKNDDGASESENENQNQNQNHSETLDEKGKENSNGNDKTKEASSSDDEKQSDDLSKNEKDTELLPPKITAIDYDPRSFNKSNRVKVIDVFNNIENNYYGGNQRKDPRLSQSSVKSPPSRPAFLYATNSNSSDSHERSPTPLAISPPLLAESPAIYTRPSMYDGPQKSLKDKDDNTLLSYTKTDRDMRIGFFDSKTSDLDLRLPFQPFVSFTPATEIDGSLLAHLPIEYKVYEIEVEKPEFKNIRRSFQSQDNILDPRVRRIFGLKENYSPSPAKYSTGGDSSSGIESPPSSTSQPSSIQPANEKEKPVVSSALRLDPRCKAAASVIESTQAQPPLFGGGVNDVKVFLQKSNWYKNLNSKYKIMVNQQLALLSTEIKKFHHDPSPTKIFDIQFILNNPSLHQILTNLDIYIDDNGEIRQVEADSDSESNTAGNSGMMLMDSNMANIPNNMSMNMDYFRGPPPVMNMMQMQQQGYGQGCGPNIQSGVGMMPFSGGGGGVGVGGGAGASGNVRPGLLGIAPGGYNNPFASGRANMDGDSRNPFDQGVGGGGNFYGGGNCNNFASGSGGGGGGGNGSGVGGNGGGNGNGGNRSGGNRNFNRYNNQRGNYGNNNNGRNSRRNYSKKERRVGGFNGD